MGAALPDPAPAAGKARGKLATRVDDLLQSWVENLRPRWLDGNEVELLERGEQYFPALVEEIGRATREIWQETYIFENDDSGRKVAEALAVAAKRGVQVHLTVDGFGCDKLDPEMRKLMSRAGVRIEVFRPGRGGFLGLNRQRLRRLHRKLCVIDGCVAFVGGINVMDDFYDQNHGVLDAPRYDFAVRARGPVVAPIQFAVHRHWWSLALINRSLRRSGRVPDRSYWKQVKLPPVPEVDIRPAGTRRAMFVLRDNLRWRHSIEIAYLNAIRAAKREILIANAYFFPGVRFRRALIRAARRGVRVRLLLQGKVEYAIQHYASQALYDELLAEGIEIVEYRKSFLHAKCAVIDDWATVGSSNIDPFSLLLARESNLFVQDAGFAATLRARLEAGMEDGGAPVVPQHHARRPWWVRGMNWVAFGVLRIAVAVSGSSARF